MKPTFVALVLVLFGCAESPTTGETSPPLYGGTPDATHPYAVGICFSLDGHCGKAQTARCTGSLIAPNLVLTARQCVDQGVVYGAQFCDATQSLMVEPRHYFVTTHDDPYAIGAKAEWRDVISVMTVPPLAVGDPPLCGKDIVLLLLAHSIPRSEAEPVQLDLYGELMPTEVALVGRGAVAAQLVTLDGTTGVQVTDDGGKRRRSREHVPVLCLPGQASSCVQPDDSVPAGTFTAHPNQLVVGGASLPGDLGAGIVDQMSFAQAPVLLAVTSGSTWDGGQPAATFGTHVRSHATFIANAMEFAAQVEEEPGGCSSTRGGSAVPALALLWLVRRRRRTIALTGRTVRRD